VLIFLTFSGSNKANNYLLEKCLLTNNCSLLNWIVRAFLVWQIFNRIDTILTVNFSVYSFLRNTTAHCIALHFLSRTNYSKNWFVPHKNILPNYGFIFQSYSELLHSSLIYNLNTLSRLVFTISKELIIWLSLLLTEEVVVSYCPLNSIWSIIW